MSTPARSSERALNGGSPEAIAAVNKWAAQYPPRLRHQLSTPDRVTVVGALPDAAALAALWSHRRRLVRMRRPQRRPLKPVCDGVPESGAIADIITVVSERVLESTPSRLGLRNAVIEVLKLAGADVAPCGGAGCRPRTDNLADLVEREAHLAEQEDRSNERDRGFVVPALPRPSIGGLQDVKLLVVAQGAPRPYAAPTLQSSAAHRRSS
jgi:hypothetical protein